jgi:hypothetical protein
VGIPVAHLEPGRTVDLAADLERRLGVQDGVGRELADHEPGLLDGDRRPTALAEQLGHVIARIAYVLGARFVHRGRTSCGGRGHLNNA